MPSFPPPDIVDCLSLSSSESLMPSSFASVVLSVLSFLVLLPGKGHAQPQAQPAWFWGVVRGCKPEPKLAQAAREYLAAVAVPVTQLPGSPTPEFAPWSPEEAGTRFQKACPHVKGRLVGAQVESSPVSATAHVGQRLERFRVWLFDLETGRIAVLDDSCEACGALGERIGRRAGLLLDKPRFGVPQALPTYCQAEVAAAPAEPRSPKVVTMILGDAKLHRAVFSQVKKDLSLAGRDAVLWTGEARIGHSDLRRMLKGDPRGQVLAIDLFSDGAKVWVYDALSDKDHLSQVHCPGCGQDDVGGQVARRGLMLLDQAASASPPALGLGSKKDGWSAWACAPFATPVCQNPASPSARPDPASGKPRFIDPTLAKLVKGSLWGLFGATTVSAGALFVANPFVVQEIDDRRFVHTLTAPAWTMAAASAGLLAVSVPITLWVQRAEREKPSPVVLPPDVENQVFCPSSGGM